MAKIKSIKRKVTPTNRIVVDYGERRELVLLAIIDNETGKDCPLVDIGIPIVEEIEWNGDFKSFQKLDIKNKEGGVFVDVNGNRCKAKFEDYCRLHRIMTGVNNIDLWKMRMFETNPSQYPEWGMTLEGIIEKVPDEFYQWIANTLQSFQDGFEEIDSKIKNLYEPMKDLGTIEFANAVKDFKNFDKVLMFSYRKGDMVRYKTLILRSLRPEHSTPFVTDKEEL